ncbi:MAG: toll/interleukin-1 receptor domain-containing protein [Leptolyngbyaceae cyanobacterium CSU_1_4]|nr:toll/interleukin-1 receptor domain-containing protein [Leptolyngbyaceae cyanobacterium CSU_1_4]
MEHTASQSERQGTVNCPDATHPRGGVASPIRLSVGYLTSYSPQDRDFANQLTQGLESEGITVWSDRSIQPGSNGMEKIEGGLEQSCHTVLIVSQESLNSPSINFEIGFALSKAAKSPDTFIIPVLTQNIDIHSLPFSTKNRSLVNAVNMNPREVGRDLGFKLHQIPTAHETSSNSHGL